MKSPKVWTTLPSNFGLYWRCAQSQLKGNPSLSKLVAPPMKRLAFNQFKMEPSQVKAYSDFVNFRVNGNSVPIFYPCLLFFPCQLMLMTEPDFPFPILGTVHLSNKMEMLRPIPLNESNFAAFVRFDENYRVHDKGICFTVVSELFDSNNKPCWRSESSYLRKCNPAKFKLQASPYQSEIKDAHVANLKSLEEWEIPSDTGFKYAKLSGDYNPIHLLKPAAKVFGSQDAIVHGMWTAGKAVASLTANLTEKQTVSTVLVEFKKPLPLSSKAKLSSSEAMLASSESFFEVRGIPAQEGEDFPCVRGRIKLAA